MHGFRALRSIPATYNASWRHLNSLHKIIYGGSTTPFGKTFKKFNWNCKFVDFDDIEAVGNAAKDPSVKAIFGESLANPEELFQT